MKNHTSVRALEAYLENLGVRLINIAQKCHVPRGLLSNINSIKKAVSTEEFEIVKHNIMKGIPVTFSNGCTSSNFCRIRQLVKQGNAIVAVLPKSVTENTRKVSTVYLLEAGGYYKIGVTLDSTVKHRLKTLQTGNPFPIRLIASGNSEDAYALEKTLHKKYKNIRMTGEWFALDEGQVAEVINALKGPSE